MDGRPASSVNEEKINKEGRLLLKILLTFIILFSASIILLGIGYLYVDNILGYLDTQEIPMDDKELGIRDEDFVFDDRNIDYSGIGDYQKEEKLPFYYEGVKGVTNIALFGIDAKEGVSGRSDAIIILTIDNNSKKIKLNSIIRDSYVHIPDRGMDKINHAYAFGGPSLALRTINSNFNLDVRYFVTVNFTSMPKIVDRIGGVEMVLTDEEAKLVPGIEKGGKYILDGRQALAYSRIRSIDSDIERARRQRDVLEAAIKKMMGMPLSSYPDIMKDVFPLISTNLSRSEMLSIGVDVITRNIRTVEQRRFPDSSFARGQRINGIYYYVFNRNATVHQMGKYIYLDEE